MNEPTRRSEPTHKSAGDPLFEGGPSKGADFARAERFASLNSTVLRYAHKLEGAFDLLSKIAPSFPRPLNRSEASTVARELALEFKRRAANIAWAAADEPATISPFAGDYLMAPDLAHELELMIAERLAGRPTWAELASWTHQNAFDDLRDAVNELRDEKPDSIGQAWLIVQECEAGKPGTVTNACAELDALFRNGRNLPPECDDSPPPSDGEAAA